MSISKVRCSHLRTPGSIHTVIAAQSCGASGGSSAVNAPKSSVKEQFLLDPSITFPNHGSFGATPKPGFNEYQRELEKQSVKFLGRRITGLPAESPAALGNYLGTHADNLVYTQNVTISLTIVARSLALGSGDEVLATHHDYGAMDRTWRFLSKEHGFRYINQHIEMPVTTEEKFIDDFWSGVTPRTRVRRASSRSLMGRTLRVRSGCISIHWARIFSAAIFRNVYMGVIIVGDQIRSIERLNRTI